MANRRTRNPPGAGDTFDPVRDDGDRTRLLGDRERRGQDVVNQRWRFLRNRRGYIFGFIAVALLYMLVIVIMSGLTLLGSTFDDVSTPTGGGFGATVGLGSLDPAALALLRDTLTTITNGCTPPPGDPVLVAVGTGTAAATRAAWVAVKDSVGPTLLNPDGGCEFYGLDAAEFASATPIGPREMCWGYVKIGLQIFLVRDQGVIPGDITQQLNDAYDIAYPLTMFFNRVPGGKGIVVGRVLELLNEATVNPSNISLFADRAARDFCNEFFSVDDLDAYDSRTQPWLGFPFPGTMQRVGNNSITGSANSVIGNIDVQLSTPVKKIFAIGDVIDKTPELRLLLQAVFGTVPTEEFAEDGIVQELNLAYEDIFDQFGNIISGDVPVLVFGRYAEEIGTWNNARVSDGSINYLVTDADPGGVLVGVTMSETILNRAETRDVLSQLDFTSDLLYEAELGRVYMDELDVAEIIMQIVRPLQAIEFNETTELFETFAIKNTRVNGTDVGGRTDVLAARNDLTVNGDRVSLGFSLTPNALQLLTSVVTDDPVAFGASVPENFSWRTERPECLPPVVNQGPCNNCWAIATGATIGSRFCTQGLTSSYAPVSRQHVTSCSGARNMQGCNPNFPETGFSFTQSVGAVDSTCFPFAQGTSRFEAPCIDECSAGGGTESQRFFSSRSSFRWLRNTNAIKLDLSQNGPLAVGFDIPTDFFQFFRDNPTGVYQNVNSKGIGGHLVLLVGYCGSCNPPYWEMQNSWGVGFADGGYFKVKINLPGPSVWIEGYAYRANPLKIETFDPVIEKVPQQDVRSQTEAVFVVDAKDSTALKDTIQQPGGPAAAAPALLAPPASLLYSLVLLLSLLFMYAFDN